MRFDLKQLYYSMVARFYDLAMRKVERLCLNRWRAELLADLDGVVLEIGAGTGVNLQYYSQNISQLVLCEPDPSMRKYLKLRLQASAHASAEVHSCAAELLDVADNSIDHLVSTLVFCSVADMQQSLREAFRVLKPGGKLIFIEHVAADKNSRLHFWQHFWQPLWRRVACNCHLTRQTAQLLKNAGFKLQLREETMQGAPSIAAPVIIGHALRP
jgi:ubiquinone/menaquinone biosynthesis C-methylase UbiE